MKQAKTARGRFEHLVRDLRQIGDEYVMLQRAIEACERFEEDIERARDEIIEDSQKSETVVVFENAARKERDELFRVMDEFEECKQAVPA